MSERPLTKIQSDVLRYISSVAENGRARVTRDEISAATGHEGSTVYRVMDALQKRGLVDIEVIRATFITIKGEAGMIRPTRPSSCPFELVNGRRA